LAQKPGRKSSPKPTSTDGDRSLALVRVLVVEDHDAFRGFVVSMLGQRPDLQIVCEASDGLEAVKIAEELQPDLIVLDIGLPGLHGIEAARRIRKLSPNSKILFVSQESSADVVQEALAAGGLGYVFKAYAQRELLVALEAALQSRQFVSSALMDGLRPTQRP
jgi:DNA-binding NarL/FixJ family response regulator